MGELGELEIHHNFNPSQDKRLEGCQFTAVPCLHCSEVFWHFDVELYQNAQYHSAVNAVKIMIPVMKM